MYVTEVGKKEGVRVPFTEDGTRITFGIEENSFAVDAAELQQDNQVSFDVMQDDNGKLGTEGNWYAATLTIPPKKYEMVEDEKNVTVSEDGEEERGLVPQEIPLDMGAVEITLYPLEKPLEEPEENGMEGMASAETEDTEEE